MAGRARDIDLDEAQEQRRSEPLLRTPIDDSSKLDSGSNDALLRELEALNRHVPRSPVASSGEPEVSRYARPLYLATGCLCVGLGSIGIFVPGLPTTIFMIIALWAFAKSSSQMRDWLYHHKHFGPSLQDWVIHRSIPTRARQIALASLLVSTLFIGYWFSGLACLAFILFVCLPVASFLWTLPSNSDN